MALSAKADSFAANTSTGSQSVSGLGFVPKVIFFFATSCTAAGTATNGILGCGWSDGVNDGACGTGWADGSSTTGARASNAACVSLVNNAGTLLFNADLTSFDADGFTLNIGTTDGLARLLGYLALGGTDLSNVRAGNYTSPGAGGSHAVTGVGFQPDCLLLMAVENATPLPATTTRGGFALGVGLSATQRHTSGHRHQSGNAASTSSSSGYRNNKILTLADDTTTPETEHDLTSLNADGFTLNRSGTNATSYEVLYLALKGARCAQGVLNARTSTGTQALTGLGFQPAALLFDLGGQVSASAYQQPARFGLGAATGTAARAAVAIAAAGSGNDHDQAFASDRCIINYAAGTPTLLAAADLSSLDADGFTLNWSTVDANAYPVAWLAVGASSFKDAASALGAEAQAAADSQLLVGAMAALGVDAAAAARGQRVLNGAAGLGAAAVAAGDAQLVPLARGALNAELLAAAAAQTLQYHAHQGAATRVLSATRATRVTRSLCTTAVTRTSRLSSVPS